MILLTIFRAGQFPQLQYQFALNGVRDCRMRPSLRAAEMAAKKQARKQYPGQSVVSLHRSRLALGAVA